VIVKFGSNSPQETFNLGQRIGKKLSGTEVILLSGDLGTGKTLLVKGIAHGLGIREDEVVSPTFTILNHYMGENFRLFHIDLYRLEGKISKYFYELDDNIDEGIIAVEWAQFLDASYFALPRLVAIQIDDLSDDRREIRIETTLSYITDCVHL